MAEPIVVTGVGAVSALGLDAAQNWAAARAGHRELDLLAAEPHRAPAVAHHRAPAHLAGNPPLAFAEHVVDRSRNRGDAAPERA